MELWFDKNGNLPCCPECKRDALSICDDGASLICWTPRCEFSGELVMPREQSIWKDFKPGMDVDEYLANLRKSLGGSQV